MERHKRPKGHKVEGLMYIIFMYRKACIAFICRGKVHNDNHINQNHYLVVVVVVVEVVDLTIYLSTFLRHSKLVNSLTLVLVYHFMFFRIG